MDEKDLSGTAKDADLFLPSDLTPEECKILGLEEIAKYELTLRQGDACEVIQAIKSATLKVRALSSENRHLKEREKNTTRGSTAVNNAKKVQEFWFDEYLTIREKMLGLGMPTDDKRFLPLTREDLYRPSTSSVPALGKGGQAPGWIWLVHKGEEGQDPSEWALEGN